jgi:hypothetical protein
VNKCHTTKHDDASAGDVGLDRTPPGVRSPIARPTIDELMRVKNRLEKVLILKKILPIDLKKSIGDRTTSDDRTKVC